MLPRINRIVRPDDFRQVVRRGDKHVDQHVIVYRRPSESTRVGVIVTRKTGNAVLRNTLRRRVRAICRSLLDAGTLSGDLVIRFRDETPSPSFAELDREIRSAVDRWLGP